MPLKILCKDCGKVMFEMNGMEMSVGKFTVPDIIYEKLGKTARWLNDKEARKPCCPHCKREISSQDLEDWALKITGKKGDRAFFSKPESRIGKEVMGFTVASTSKKRVKRFGNYLVKGHDEPTEF